MVKFWLAIQQRGILIRSVYRAVFRGFSEYYRTWTEENRESGLQNHPSLLPPRPDESRPRRYKKNPSTLCPFILALSPPLRVLFTGEFQISTSGGDLVLRRPHFTAVSAVDGKDLSLYIYTRIHANKSSRENINLLIQVISKRLRLFLEKIADTRSRESSRGRRNARHCYPPEKYYETLPYDITRWPEEVT